MKTSELPSLTYSYLQKKNVQWTIAIILLLLIIITSTNIRVSNIDTLKDQTTGEFIPLALDPFYFLRMAETYEATGQNFPVYDSFRTYPGGQVEWNSEIMPYAVVAIYKIASIFNDTVSLQYIMIISPVIFFVLGLILFAAIVYVITKNKWTAIIASALLAYSPAYLYRTMAGFSDHESIGMFGFFIALLLFTLAVKTLGKKKKPGLTKGALWGIAVGAGTAISITSWTGGAKFLTIIIPLTMVLIWIYYAKSIQFKHQILLFYTLWIAVTYIVTVFILGFSAHIIVRFFTSSTGIISIGILGFMIIDYIVEKIKYKKITKENKIYWSIIITIVFATIALAILGRNPFELIWSIAVQLINPFGTGRIGLTVAENKAPYLGEWIAQTGKTVFWMFFLGIGIYGYRLTRQIKGTKEKVTFYILFAALVSGILFSKYSASSILNGENAISIAVYFIPLIMFAVYFFKLYTKENIKWTRIECFIFAWMIFTLISGRAATRVFFAITPFVCFMAAYLVTQTYIEWTRSKEKLTKTLLVTAFIIAIIATYITISSSYAGIASQAQYISPSADSQWQHAMQWVRENTPQDAVFNHWWDYGYWVQYLGKRATVSDGGHFQNGFGGDHKVGRYVLTTPRPETALSFFKTMNVDYLLIDQTDLGKYSAYSSIGSDEKWDRFSVIPIGISDLREVKETNNGTQTLYKSPSTNQAFGIVDEDISYDSDNDGKVDIFLPGPTYSTIGTPSYKSYLVAIETRVVNNELAPPRGLYVYNNQQYTIPIRYMYYNEQLYDFNTGIDAVVSVIPQVNSASMNPTGAMIYLSPRVSKSLFAQLYLLDDAFNNYPTITLEHSEPDAVLQAIASQGIGEYDMVYYQGFRGAIKIFDTTNIPSNIQKVPGFYNTDHTDSDYAILDNETFIK